MLINFGESILILCYYLCEELSIRISMIYKSI
jgi:hypothetical protein